MHRRVSPLLASYARGFGETAAPFLFQRPEPLAVKKGHGGLAPIRAHGVDGHTAMPGQDLTRKPGPHADDRPERRQLYRARRHPPRLEYRLHRQTCHHSYDDAEFDLSVIAARRPEGAVELPENRKEQDRVQGQPDQPGLFPDRKLRIALFASIGVCG